MQNNNLIDLMVFFQLMSFGIVYLEMNNISKDWKKLPLKTKIGRIFMLNLPILVIISLLINPIS